MYPQWTKMFLEVSARHYWSLRRCVYIFCGLLPRTRFCLHAGFTAAYTATTATTATVLSVSIFVFVLADDVYTLLVCVWIDCYFLFCSRRDCFSGWFYTPLSLCSSLFSTFPSSLTKEKSKNKSPYTHHTTHRIHLFHPVYRPPMAHSSSSSHPPIYKIYFLLCLFFAYFCCLYWKRWCQSPGHRRYKFVLFLRLCCFLDSFSSSGHRNIKYIPSDVNVSPRCQLFTLNCFDRAATPPRVHRHRL